VISDGKRGDALALDLITPEAGAIYVMDRGYVDFRRLYTIHQAGAFFVTRTKINMKYHRVYSIRRRTRQPGSVPTKALRSMDFIPNKIIPSTYAASRSVIQRPVSVLCS
jgi:hypothetical protein